MIQNIPYSLFLRVKKVPFPPQFISYRVGKRNLPEITQGSNATCAQGPLEIGMTLVAP